MSESIQEDLASQGVDASDESVPALQPSQNTGRTVSRRNTESHALLTPTTLRPITMPLTTMTCTDSRGRVDSFSSTTSSEDSIQTPYFESAPTLPIWLHAREDVDSGKPAACKVDTLPLHPSEGYKDPAVRIEWSMPWQGVAMADGGARSGLALRSSHGGDRS